MPEVLKFPVKESAERWDLGTPLCNFMVELLWFHQGFNFAIIPFHLIVEYLGGKNLHKLIIIDLIITDLITVLCSNPELF